MTRASQTLVAIFVAIGLGVPTLAGAQGRTAPSGSGSVGTATSRGGGGSSSGGGGGSASPAGSGGSVGSATPRTGGGSSGSSSGRAVPSRDRNGRPVVGTATNRPLYNTVTGLPIPIFGPWGRYFPWYNVGFGYDYGFVQFSPYWYSGYYGWGPWSDPFFYDPFNPFGYGYNVFRYGSYGSDYGYMGGGYGGNSTPTHVTGSIRLKVSPDDAKVYVDGVLAGAANEFDGLVGDHLVLESGSHQLELRADGYETYHGTISVEAGKTLTERVSMKKTK